MIQPNTFLQNRYRVVKHIGEGGMGAVYVATDERFGSTVALKETFFRDAVMLRAFEREAKLLNRLRHPALPRVSDHFTEGEGQFLVMEFIAGEDLSAMLERRGEAFPVKDVLRWADELLDALDYLHTQEPSIIHRDIKPQNLKLTPRGQIILLDFGLAKGTPWQASHATASVYGYSRNYAPIEQIQGTGTDTRSDIYSLGATLYHLLTAQPPPDALTRAMAVLNHQADPLRLASEVHPQVSASVAAVIARAMAQTAAGRPASAAAMREELRRASSESGANDARAFASPLAATVTLPAQGATTPAQKSSEQETQILGTGGAQPTMRDTAAQPTDIANRRVAALGETKMVNDATTGATDSEATRISNAPVVARDAARRTSPARRFAVVGLVAALAALVAAFVYNFSFKSRMADETNAPQISQPAPQTTDAQTNSTTNSAAPTETQTVAKPSAPQQVAPVESRHGVTVSSSRTESQPAAPSNARAQTNETRVETKPVEASPTPNAPEDEFAAPNAPPPRGVIIPPNIDWVHMTPAQRKKFIRYVRRQVGDEQRRAYDPQQQPQPFPRQPQPFPPRRRRQPPPSL